MTSKSYTKKELVSKLLNFNKISDELVTDELNNTLVLSVNVMLKMKTNVLKSEHILYGLLLYSSQNHLKEESSLCIFLREKSVNVKELMSNLESRELWQSASGLEALDFFYDADEDVETCNLTYGTNKILSMLQSLSTRIKLDSLALLGSIVLEGTSVAADVVRTVCKSKLNSKVFFKKFQLTNADIGRPNLLKFDNFETKIINKGIVSKFPAFIPSAKSDLKINVMKAKDKFAPDETNWVIYPNLLIGGNPGQSRTRFKNLLKMKDNDSGEDIGRTTFVCLMGEYKNLESFYENNYPRLLKGSMAKEINKEISFMHYPIHDFEASDIMTLRNLIDELKRRILKGERVFLHCRGGHGRTGMVVIPLVAAIYKLPFNKAAKWVRNSYAVSERGRSWQWMLPETKEQEAVAKSIIGFVHKNKRGM